jgi:hypothetical protein
MSHPGYVPGMPRVGARVNAVHRIVFKSGQWDSDLAGGKMIDGAKSRDASNSPDVGVLRAGKLMGKVTAGGLYRPSVIGQTGAAALTSDTALTVSAAVAAEVARLKALGGGGDLSLKLVGPPTAGGTVAETPLTVTAVGATTLTLSAALGVAKVTGSLITPADGSESPLSFIPDGYGVPVLDFDAASLPAAPFAPFPIAGVVLSGQVIDWPADASTRAWVVGKMNAAAGGQWVFDHIY